MSLVLWIVSLPLRIIGYAAVIGAFAAGAWDVWQSVDADRLVLTPFGSIWYELSPASLNIMQAAIQRHILPALWDPVMITYLNLPAFMALLILAAVALFLAQLIYRPR